MPKITLAIDGLIAVAKSRGLTSCYHYSDSRDGELFGFCRLIIGDREESSEISMTDARLIHQMSKVWEIYPGRMLSLLCLSLAIRAYFCDAVNEAENGGRNA